jgi:hypothetical protein
MSGTDPAVGGGELHGSLRFCYTKRVRGDSRRDLYAKALAVLGLGLLAGAGALVDYWPVHIGIPAVRDVMALPPDLPRPVVTASTFENRTLLALAPPAPAAEPVDLGQPAEGLRDDASASDDSASLLSATDAAATMSSTLTWSVSAATVADLGLEGTSVPAWLPSDGAVDAPQPLTASRTPGGNRLKGVAVKTAHGVGEAGTAVRDGAVAVGSAFRHLFRFF